MGARQPKIIFFLPFFLLFSVHVGAQSLKSFKPGHEIGGFIGTSYYLGEINQNTHFKNTQPAFGGVFRFYKTSFLSIVLAGTYAKIEGNDAQSSNDFQIDRNLSFSSSLLEVRVGLEFNFFNYKSPYYQRFGTPFFGIGAGVLSFNPKATDATGNNVPLQPLSTEGQGTSASDKEPYKLITATVPVEFGYRFRIKQGISGTFSYGLRVALTDYLDDVSGFYPDQSILTKEVSAQATYFSDKRLGNTKGTSGGQRGNPNTLDMYFVTSLGITFDIVDRNPDTSCSVYKAKKKYNTPNKKKKSASIVFKNKKQKKQKYKTKKRKKGSPPVSEKAKKKRKNEKKQRKKIKYRNGAEKATDW